MGKHEIFSREEVGRCMQMAIDLASKYFYSLDKESAAKIMAKVKQQSADQEKEYWKNLGRRAPK